MSKPQFANFKCVIRGKNDLSTLEQIPNVLRIEQKGEESILYLEKDIHPVKWAKNLPDELIVNELSIDRISLHEIFIDIATDKNLIGKEVGENE